MGSEVFALWEVELTDSGGGYDDTYDDGAPLLSFTLDSRSNEEAEACCSCSGTAGAFGSFAGATIALGPVPSSAAPEGGVLTSCLCAGTFSLPTSPPLSADGRRSW